MKLQNEIRWHREEAVASALRQAERAIKAGFPKMAQHWRNVADAHERMAVRLESKAVQS